MGHYIFCTLLGNCVRTHQSLIIIVLTKVAHYIMVYGNCVLFCQYIFSLGVFFLFIEEFKFVFRLNEIKPTVFCYHNLYCQT